jgi:hypothetical protein
MLSKCANPTCSATFRFLSEGKVFLVDSKAALARCRFQAELKCAGSSCIYEYFWLCSSCCRDMTIQIDHRLEVSVIRKPGPPQDSEPNLQGQAQRKTSVLPNVCPGEVDHP